MNKKAITLIEIIVATLILALTLAGLANLFISGKRWVLISKSRMTGGEVGKFFLDPLQNNMVRADTWGNPANCLSVGACPNQIRGPADGLDRNYNVVYAINNNQPIPNVNRVTATITWNVEP